MVWVTTGLVLWRDLGLGLEYATYDYRYVRVRS